MEGKRMAKGIVFYTDGGARPNPGFAGSGMHGYYFEKEEPKKGAGQAENVLTADGYVLKKEMAEMPVVIPQVTPIEYYDGFAAYADTLTNNFAELNAVCEALEFSLSRDVNEITVITDSEYVRKGIEGWIVVWEKNNWTLRDGSPVKNVDSWKRLEAIRVALKEKSVTLNCQWVRGHNDNLGNEKADKLATLAVMHSRNNRQNFVTFETKPAEGYWKADNERHPFISSRNIYINTGVGLHEPGTYYTGDHGNEDDMYCKRISDGSYAMILLKQPDPTVEKVIKVMQDMAEGEESLAILRLDNIFRPETHKEVAAWGSLAMVRNDPSRLDLYCLDHTSEDPHPMTRELRPAKLAMRAVETTAMLEEKLYDFLNSTGKVVSTDLTSILYETEIKTPKKGEPITVMKFKSDFNVGFTALPVEARFRDPSGVEKTAPVILSMGIDMLPRNPLKRLEELNPVVTLITWSESEDVFRYATVIQAGEDVGIWAGIYSNIRVVPA